MIQKILMVLVTFATLAGCATSPSEQAAQEPQEIVTVKPPEQSRQVQVQREAPKQEAAPVTPSATACRGPQQAGCLEIRALNARYNAEKHSALATKLSPEQKEKYALTLGEQIWSGYRAGTERVSNKARGFYFIVYNGGAPIPASEVTSYRVNGKESRATRVTVRDVTDRVKVPTTDLKLQPIGKPRVYYVKTEGDEAIGASIQLQYAHTGARTYVLVCPEDKLSVYPDRVSSPSANDGHWIMPETIEWAKTKGKTRALLPFLSKDS